MFDVESKILLGHIFLWQCKYRNFLSFRTDDLPLLPEMLI